MTDSTILIPYVNLSAQWKEDRSELLPIIDNVLGSGHYIGGEEVEKFENSIANLCHVKFAIALNSGTDALTMALHVLGISPGDEVITPPNSFISSTAVIMHLGAKPVFVDVLPDQNIDPAKIEAALSEKTKAIMPVHLNGRVCDMDPIMDIARKHGLMVVEDAAQSIGSKYKDYPSGSFGHIGCFSTHPLKNLNACGDGGFITTNDKKIFSKVKALRNHGMSDRNTVNMFGYVSRMDNLQATILNYRLGKLDDIIQKRRNNAKKYLEEINTKLIDIEKEKDYEFNTYHTFVIKTERRDVLKKYLFENGIETAIHYPTPIHLQPASESLGHKAGDFPIAEKQAEQILTLPVNQSLKQEDIQKIISKINSFFSN